MKYTIVLSETARRHIRYLLHQGLMTQAEHQRLVNAMYVRLLHQPTVTQGSVKELRQPNRLLATYELSIKPWRVLYNVEEMDGMVHVKAVGFKPRERLFIEGEEVVL